jgi:hypothetical protein
VLDGNAAGARSMLDRLDELGTRGRTVDADRTAIEAGIAALGGDRTGALAGYRAALAAWRTLRLPWDEALTALDAATVLGADDPEVAGWVDTARATFERLRATPMLARLDDAVRAGAGAGEPAAAAADGNEAAAPARDDASVRTHA